MSPDSLNPGTPDPPLPRAAVVNIGCRLNQSEGDSLRRYLQAQGYELETGVGGLRSGSRFAHFHSPIPTPHPLPPDLVLINTCCVTSEAERSSLNRIRRVASLRPKPRIVVTGCLAELAPERLRQIAGVDEVLGIQDKERLTAGRSVLPDRSRAFLKIQDGCSNHCTFCVVSTLRTRSYSKPPTQVVAETRDLVDQGFREIVLVGLNLGTYDAGCSLAGLLTELAAFAGRCRFRLGSLEPETVSPELVSVLTEACRVGVLCPHLHIPLQSGADRMLAAMNRHCRAGSYQDLVDRLVGQIPDVNIGADVIVGFPGEDESSLAATGSLVERLPLGYLHVFSYSPRPGTAACRLAVTLPRIAQKSAVAELRAIGEAKSCAYRQRFIGCTRPAVPVPGRRDSSPVTVVTDNFISVETRVSGPLPGMVRIRIDRISGENTFGTLADAGGSG
jgi:threonylcarbamoyladenosine tRNA methylthiotransferase MtaB